MSVLSRLVTAAPVAVFAIAGVGARTALLALRGDGRVAFVSSPRHATVLLVGGAVTDQQLETVLHVHDQLPEPRALVWWRGDDGEALGPVRPVAVAANAEVVDVVIRVHRELVSGRRRSSPPVGPEQNPVSWRGVGPHGQGGEGMMGGEPYGRSMAMTGPDVRDGLELDRVTLPIGPALPGLPPGLAMVLELQGDLIQQVDLADNPFLSTVTAGRPLPSATDVFDLARANAVPIAELELARARYHLLRLGEVLALYGLDAASQRAAGLAAGLRLSDVARLRRLRGWLRRTAALWGATSGVGRIDAGEASDAGLSGLAARAAGLAVDARTEEQAYRAAGFEPRTRNGGDAHDRWLLRVDEAIDGLVVGAAAGEATVGPGDGVEDPRQDASILLEHLPHWLAGLEWGDAITTVASLDLDLEAADRRPATAVHG